MGNDTTYGFGDYIGDLLAYGINNDPNLTMQPDAIITNANGSTFMQKIAYVIENPKLFAIWSLMELVLTLSWMRNPWPFPSDSITKHPGALEIFRLLYFSVSMIYFLFFKAKKTLEGDPDSGDLPGVYEDKNGFPGGLAAKVYGVFGSIFVFVLAIIGVFILIRRFDIFYYLLTYGMSICIVIFAIALIYLIIKPMFKNWKVTPNGVFGIIFDFILFLPCLAIAGIQWFLDQESGKKIDGKPDPFFARKSLIWIVLLVEMTLIALQFAIPYIFNKIATHDGKHLLKDPVYLNKKHVLATFEDLNGKISPTDKDPYKYTYSISAWIYINPQPPSTSPAYGTYTPLLSYGNKPAIEYYGKTNELRVISEAGLNKDGTTKIATISSTKNFQYQKWNNFVINYDGANMDVFINGELVGTQPNIAPYMNLDDLIVGHANGINGGICNVVYYDRVLTQSSIMLSYKTLRDKTPPVL